ncbi:MAG: HNH endonuclease [Caldilineaceae bacterium]|nr:HNH endonuclease [Caldilineaceae bacterium]
MLEIDHIVPVTHGGRSQEDNLALACPMCNGHKSDLTEAIDPQTGLSVRLFDPRRQRWSDHFSWDENGTVVAGLTSTGRANVKTLPMNHPDIITVRQLWVSVGWHPPKS